KLARPYRSIASFLGIPRSKLRSEMGLSDGLGPNLYRLPRYGLISRVPTLYGLAHRARGPRPAGRADPCDRGTSLGTAAFNDSEPRSPRGTDHPGLSAGASSRTTRRHAGRAAR